MIITVGHTKGGVGKSTLALNIAIERSRVGSNTLIIDGDAKQASISKAIGIRVDAGQLPALSCTILEDANTLRHQIGRLKSQYQDIVIDVGGYDSNSLRAALTVSDALLLPVAPESIEVWAIDDMLSLVREARRIQDFRVLAVLNRGKSVGQDNSDTIKVIREYTDIDLLPGTIGSRSVFGNAFGRGQSVAEYKPSNPKARLELAGLMQSIYAD